MAGYVAKYPVSGRIEMQFCTDIFQDIVVEYDELQHIKISPDFIRRIDYYPGQNNPGMKPVGMILFLISN